MLWATDVGKPPVTFPTASCPTSSRTRRRDTWLARSRVSGLHQEYPDNWRVSGGGGRGEAPSVGGASAEFSSVPHFPAIFSPSGPRGLLCARIVFYKLFLSTDLFIRRLFTRRGFSIGTSYLPWRYTAALTGSRDSKRAAHTGEYLRPRRA